MKRKQIIFIIFAFSMLPSCMGTDSYYQAQKAYYEAQAVSNQAYIASHKPIAEMIAPDGTVFRVNSQYQPPVIHSKENPIVAGLKTIVNSTPMAIITGGWSAREIIKASSGDIINSSGVNTNSGNTQTFASDSIDQSTSTTTDDHAAVSTPTIIEQPQPVIVDQPDPVIITQPEPIIMTQPEPIVITQPKPVIINNKGI